MAVKIKMTGLDKMQKAIDAMAMRVVEAVETGVYLAANNVMTESKEMVPVDMGVLRASGYVTRPKLRGGKVLAELGYGGPAEDYAKIQHDYPHAHPEGGTDHYLQKAIDAGEGEFRATVTALAAQALKGAKVRSAGGANPEDPWTIKAGSGRKASQGFRRGASKVSRKKGRR